METDFGKRVYQGVRVKHTVKDLLAEKRSRQSTGSRFSGSTSATQSPFVQMPGSKPFSCDSSATQGYPALLDQYLGDQYGDYRPTSLTAGASSFFSPSAVPPLLPSFPNETAHFLLREPWEQTSPDSLSQSDNTCSDPLQALPASITCLSSHESGGVSPYRSSSWTPAIPGTQPYPLHPLEDVHYSSSYAATSSYSFSPFMTVANELTSRMSHLSPEQSSEMLPLHENSAWAKEDGSPIWGTSEGRRTY
ncbi:POU domain class 2-associating factor 2 isoform X2 [Phaenicophaeus curvirostris]|uniref:POU domain class 2-associating factor 2 isoform X2 n=1 Tax=Phaenicophaeus curvirostris TaxID=33595 RepID=UPI0037F0C665